MLYIQSALERNENPVRTMLVSASGMGINQMLCDKICRSFSLIHSVKVVSVHDFKIEKVEDVDLILTTRELGLHDPRIVEIDDFLSDASIQKINHWIRNTILNKVSEAQFDADCHQLFEPDLIFTHLEIDDKPALLKFLCDRLVRKGYVTRKYVKTVLDLSLIHIYRFHKVFSIDAVVFRYFFQRIGFEEDAVFQAAGIFIGEFFFQIQPVSDFLIVDRVD